MPFNKTKVNLSTAGVKSFQLEEDLSYQGSVEAWTVPKGFETDFATVPQVIQWLIPTYGLYTLAAILHDYFCVELKEAYINNRKPFITSRNTDGVFRRVMRELGVPFAQRWLMWTGVRWGALANSARREGILADLPLMTLVSILSAPVVVPATIFVALGLGLAKLFNLVFRVFK